MEIADSDSVGSRVVRAGWAEWRYKEKRHDLDQNMCAYAPFNGWIALQSRGEFTDRLRQGCAELGRISNSIDRLAQNRELARWHRKMCGRALPSGKSSVAKTKRGLAGWGANVTSYPPLSSG